MNLDALHEGECALVQRMELCDALRHRLLDLGLIEGTKIRILRRSRSASVLWVRGTMLALRKRDLEKIGVEPCD